MDETEARYFCQFTEGHVAVGAPFSNNGREVVAVYEAANTNFIRSG